MPAESRAHICSEQQRDRRLLGEVRHLAVGSLRVAGGSQHNSGGPGTCVADAVSLGVRVARSRPGSEVEKRRSTGKHSVYSQD